MTDRTYSLGPVTVGEPEPAADTGMSVPPGEGPVAHVRRYLAVAEQDIDASEIVDIVSDDAADFILRRADLAGVLARLDELEAVQRRARDYLERPGFASQAAIGTARYILTGEAM